MARYVAAKQPKHDFNAIALSELMDLPMTNWRETLANRAELLLSHGSRFWMDETAQRGKLVL